jgi:hypothetical protein
MLTLAESTKIFELLKPATDAAGRTSSYINVKTLHEVEIVFHVQQGNAATIALSIVQATDASGTGSKAITVAIPIWSNLDTAATDTLVRRTDAVSYTTDAGVKNKIVVFKVDPALLDIAGGFNFVAITTGASNAANLTQAIAYGETRYPQATPTSAV